MPQGPKYSEGAAGRRVAGARCLREHPEVAELLLEGKVTLCNIATAAKSIRAEETKIEEIIGKTSRDLQVMLAPALERKPKERVRPIVLTKKACDSSVPKETAPQQKEERYEIRFSVTKEVYEEFEELKNELSNKLGRDLSLEAVFTELVRARKAKANARKHSECTRTTPSASRRIPVAVKREVKSRDDCQCAYVAPDGTRCAERRYLQYDHIKPAASGGKSVADNLRMLCFSHNKLLAEQYFGRDKVQWYAGLKQRR